MRAGGGYTRGGNGECEGEGEFFNSVCVCVCVCVCTPGHTVSSATSSSLRNGYPSLLLLREDERTREFERGGSPTRVSTALVHRHTFTLGMANQCRDLPGKQVARRVVLFTTIPYTRSKSISRESD
jgi:hypothetical protein